MRSTPALDAAAGLERLATYPFHIATWVDERGYPVSVAVHAKIDAASRAASVRTARGPHASRRTATSR